MPDSLKLPTRDLDSTSSATAFPLEDRSLLFLRIQKTASKSVENLLFTRFALSGIAESVHTPQGDKLDVNAFPFVSGHVNFGFIKRFARRPVIVTFLREPLDRALSAYYYFRRESQETLELIRATYPPEWAEERIRYSERSLELGLLDFLQQEPELAQTRLANMQTRVLLSSKGLWDKMAMSDEEMLQEAKKNLEACDIVGLTERLNDSLALMEHRLNWEGLGPIPHHNANPNRRRVTDEDPQALAILAGWNQLDIELYAFAQDLFEKRLEQRRSEMSPSTAACRFSAGVRQLPDASAFTFDQPIHGRGWEPRETQNGEWFAWMGVEKEAWIDLQTEGVGDHKLRCRIAHVLRSSVLQGLRIYINGQPVDIAVRPEGAFFIVDGIVPSSVMEIGGGRVRIVFAVTETVRPRDLNPELSDSRSLGIALSAISLTPTDTTGS